MITVAFYRCTRCNRINEKRGMLWQMETKGKGCICGSSQFVPTEVTDLEMFVFVLFNPSYLLAAILSNEKWIR